MSSLCRTRPSFGSSQKRPCDGRSLPFSARMSVPRCFSRYSTTHTSADTVKWPASIPACCAIVGAASGARLNSNPRCTAADRMSSGSIGVFTVRTTRPMLYRALSSTIAAACGPPDADSEQPRQPSFDRARAAIDFETSRTRRAYFRICMSKSVSARDATGRARGGRAPPQCPDADSSAARRILDG